MNIKPAFELVDEIRRNLENLSVDQLKDEMEARDAPLPWPALRFRGSRVSADDGLQVDSAISILGGCFA